MLGNVVRGARPFRAGSHRFIYPALSQTNSAFESCQQRTFLVGPAYKMAKKVLPRMSKTEKAALESGTVGFDRDLFSGSPKLSTLLDKYSAELTFEERNFLNNEVNELCEMLNDHQIMEDKDYPQEVWDFLKKKGFFAMIIPKEYGGLGFSGHGHSQVLVKVASRCPAVAATVAVPNSLGPAELLMRYGTEDQKNYFLPRLASGASIPCFGLTGATSGSDAANMEDGGVVCTQDGVLGIRASFNKRYITLAPIANCVGLAIDVSDPDNLLGGLGEEGITVALLERDHPGLEMGARHDPLGVSFMNGPVRGSDVFIPMSCVIGGQNRVGFGWNMLMDCLAEGRSISLPSSGVAAAKLSATAVGAYARVRKQFKVPIAEMEGVKEHLARIGSNAFIMAAGQHLINAMINQHEQPAVLSGVCKQQITHRARSVVIDAMDVLGGAGIMRGPNNFMASAYISMPVAITVEGANTLTRSMIIFGQGLMRSHPHLFSLVRSIQAGDQAGAFRAELGNVVGHLGRSLGASVSRSVLRRRRFVDDLRGQPSNLVSYYESQLSRLAANFALCADLGLVLGGKLKFLEGLSGRYADVLSHLYLGYACLWFFEKKRLQGARGLDAVLELAMEEVLHDTQQAFRGLFANFPSRAVAGVMRGACFPWGFPYGPPADELRFAVAQELSSRTGLREVLGEHVFVSENNDHDRVRRLLQVFEDALAADQVARECRKDGREPTLAEEKLLERAEQGRREVIQVDDFERLGAEALMGAAYKRPAMRQAGEQQGGQDTQSGGGGRAQRGGVAAAQVSEEEELESEAAAAAAGGGKKVAMGAK